MTFEIINLDSPCNKTLRLAANPAVLFWPDSKDSYEVMVIDREDSKVKILGFKYDFFYIVGHFKETTGIHPGLNEGPDWKITVRENGKVIALPLDPAPFTEEEKVSLKECLVFLKERIKVHKEKFPELYKGEYV